MYPGALRDDALGLGFGGTWFKGLPPNGTLAGGGGGGPGGGAFLLPLGFGGTWF